MNLFYLEFDEEYGILFDAETKVLFRDLAQPLIHPLTTEAIETFPKARKWWFCKKDQIKAINESFGKSIHTRGLKDE